MRIEVTPAIVLTDADVEVQTSRSGGAGGQHVNKTESKVLLRFHLTECPLLHPAVKERIRQAHPGKLTDAGELLVTCDVHRDQHRNLDDASAKLVQIIKSALVPPRPRRKTKPTKGSQRRRIAEKKHRGETKKHRGRVGDD